MSVVLFSSIIYEKADLAWGRRGTARQYKEEGRRKKIQKDLA